MRVLLISIMLFTLLSCASHAPIKPVDLNTDLRAQAEKQSQNDVEVMVMALHDKQQLDFHFDDDLIHYGLLPVQVSVDNTSFDPCSIGVSHASLIDPEGNSRPVLTFKQVYDETYKSYWRMVPWAVLCGPLCALGSLVDVAVTNEDIKADYANCMLKDGEMVADAHTAGVLFFEIDNKIQSLDGWKVQVGITKDSDPFYFVFDLNGTVEQPRIKNPREPVSN